MNGYEIRSRWKENDRRNAANAKCHTIHTQQREGKRGNESISHATIN
jgi:hypothetical protein